MFDYLNETLKSIGRRRSTRSFSDKPIDSDLIKVLLDAANQAPSAHNRQSWRFIIIRGEKKSGLAKLISEKATSFPKASAALMRMSARTINNAPVVIAIANSGELIDHGKRLFQIDDHLSEGFFRTMEIQSSSAAVQNLLLAATSLELGSVWLGIMYLIKDEILEYLNEPKGEFMAVVALGYPEKPSLKPSKLPLYKVTSFAD
jgi:nitroreductase